MEGSLWVYGHTRLADYLTGDLSLRELFNRWMALPEQAPIWAVLAEDAERAASHKKAAEIDDALAIFKHRR